MSKIGVGRFAHNLGQEHMLAQSLGCEYWRKVAGVRPSASYAYRPLWEASGAVAYDYSGLGDHAAYTGIGGRKANPEGTHLAAGFNAAPSHVNLLSAEFTARFNGAEGTCLIWAKANSAARWTDGAVRWMVQIYTDGDNRILLRKSSVNNTLLWYQKAGGTVSQVSLVLAGIGTAWFTLAMTWSKSADQLKAYYNGSQSGTTQTGLGIYAGALTMALLGASDTIASEPWLGNLAHFAIWNVPLTAGEIQYLSEV